MTTTATAPQGFYTHRTRNYDGTFNSFTVLVEVVGETAQSFKVRLLQPLVGHPKGKLMTVRQHNVRLKGVRFPQREVDNSRKWWQN